ncbi:MAG TPA: hypothetical protein VGI04_00920 [Neobacillus sp.]|jgi:hypothetical protein
MDKEKALAIGTGTFLSVVGLGAIVAGLGFILKPDGTGVGMSVDLLENSPFADFLIPGIILLTINGICSLIGAFLAFIRHRNAGIALMVLGGAMIIWILAQVYWFGWASFLQPVFLVIGAAEMAFGIFLDSQHPDNQGIFTGRGNHDSHAH